MILTIVYIKILSYICSTTWIIKLTRNVAPLCAVMFPLNRVIHVVTPSFGVLTYPCSISVTGQTKDSVSVRLWQKQIPATSENLLTGSVIPFWVKNAMPLSGEDVKNGTSRFFNRLFVKKDFEQSRIMTGKGLHLLNSK